MRKRPDADKVAIQDSAAYQTFSLDRFEPLGPRDIRRHNATISHQRRRRAGHRRDLAITPKRLITTGGSLKQVRAFEVESDDDVKVSSNVRTLSQRFSTSVRPIRPMIRNNVVDPFDAFACKMDSQAHTLLRVALDEIIPANFRGELLATGQPPWEHREYVNTQHRIQSCILGDETDIYPILAAITARIAALSHDVLSREKQTAYYVYRAISSLRTKLDEVGSESKLTPQLLASMGNLLSAQWYSGNLEAAHAHGRVLLDLYSSTQAAHLKVDFVKRVSEMQRRRDVELAAETDTQPLWQEKPHQPLPLAPERLDKIRLELSDLPGSSIDLKPQSFKDNYTELVGSFDALLLQTRHRESFAQELLFTKLSLLPILISFGSSYAGVPETGLLSLKFQKIISKFFEPWSCMALWCFTQHQASTDDGWWLDETGVALSHKLLSLKRPSDATCGWREHLENAFRLSLIALLAQFHNGSYFRVTTVVLARLRGAIERIEEAVKIFTGDSIRGTVYDLYGRLSLVEARFLLWMVRVGLTFTDNAADHEWFDKRCTLLGEVCKPG